MFYDVLVSSETLFLQAAGPGANTSHLTVVDLCRDFCKLPLQRMTNSIF